MLWIVIYRMLEATYLLKEIQHSLSLRFPPGPTYHSAYCIYASSLQILLNRKVHIAILRKEMSKNSGQEYKLQKTLAFTET